jgi:hypothetical protein
MNGASEKHHAHDLIERLPESQIETAVRFLEFMLLDPVSRALAVAPVEDEEIGEEEEQAVARSKEWFKNNEGIPFEQVVAECGFTMDQVRNQRLDKEAARRFANADSGGSR